MNNNSNYINEVRRHLFHWKEQYDNFKQKNKAAYANQSIGAIRATLCILSSIDAENQETYDEMIKIIATEGVESAFDKHALTIAGQV